MQVGAKPVFADSLENSWQIDPEDIRYKITQKTKAIIITHLYGQSADMDSIMQIAKEHNLLVIEDCAEAFGTFYKSNHVGTFGDIGAFSFFGNKTITCGEGGMVTAKDKTVYERIKHLKNQGVSENKQYWHDAIAFNYRMTNMQAAIGLAQIERAKFFIDRKREIYELYRKHLNDLPINIHLEQPDTIHSFWMISVLVRNFKDREGLREYLKNKEIETRPLFYPVHTMPMYNKNENFPIAQSLGSRGINLPSWPGLEDKQVEYICLKINEYYKENS